MISFHKTRIGSRSRIGICGLLVSASMPVSAKMKFTHHVLLTDYPNTGRYAQCGFADFDKDGKIDFFNGESYQTTGMPITEATADSHSLGVADFDRDGDLDILVVETEWETTDVRPRWFVWENMDGKGADYVRRVIFAGIMGGHEPQIVDMDGDGDIDIIFREHDPKSYNAVGGKKHIEWMENVTVPTTNLFLKNSPNKRALAYQVNANQSMDIETVGEGERKRNRQACDFHTGLFVRSLCGTGKLGPGCPDGPGRAEPVISAIE